MEKLQMLYEEYQNNELLNENYTFDEILDLYEEWKESTSKSFNNFIQDKLKEDENSNN